MMNRMKALVAVAFALALGTVLLTACGGKVEPEPAPAPVDVAGFKTLGDVMTAAPQDNTVTWDESKLVFVGRTPDGGLIYATAAVSPDVNDRIEALDFFADDYDEQRDAILATLPLTSVQDLSANIPSQDELDKLIGKTGKDLLDDGYLFMGYSMWGGTETAVYMDKGDYRFLVVFDGTVADADDADGGAAIKDMKVLELRFMGASAQLTDSL
ncbi:MAG: hypothetical protein IJJ14_02430 [Coriobacteriales bacterium]|nr:hypothetical protein [Coriobacteriales bacterium]MBQ6586241.1 hypothetical protein [Coriobacteriales bacterium]